MPVIKADPRAAVTCAETGGTLADDDVQLECRLPAEPSGRNHAYDAIEEADRLYIPVNQRRESASSAGTGWK